MIANKDISSTSLEIKGNIQNLIDTPNTNVIIIIIIESRWHHGDSWVTVATQPYHPSFLAGLLDRKLCPIRADVTLCSLANIGMSVSCNSLQNYSVSLGCWIHQLHLCRGVRPPPSMGVQYMTLNNLMVRFQRYWSFGECGVSLYCHYSQIHSALEW